MLEKKNKWKYQTRAHLATSRQTFDIMISLSLFWYYREIMILSWYLKISSPFTPRQIRANIWYYHIAIAILILSWYYDILWYYHDISKYQASPQIDTSWQTVDSMILLSIFWYYHNTVYADIIMISQNIKPLQTHTHPDKHLILWYCFRFSDIIMIL